MTNENRRYISRTTALWICVILILLPLYQLIPLRPLFINHKLLLVEVCRTRLQRERGLQDRRYLPDNRGMLFVFHRPRILRFWMKDTYIPLDIAFLNKKKEIIDIQRMLPDQGREIHSSAGMAEYALEVNAGWFEKHGVKVRDKVYFWIG